MTPAVAERLDAAPGDPGDADPVHLSHGEPVMLSVSWEPAELTEGTPVMFPRGRSARRARGRRADGRDRPADHAPEETVSARPALAAEAERLRIRPGSAVLTIARIYYTAERPVETASIVLPVERYSLVYEIPVH